MIKSGCIGWSRTNSPDVFKGKTTTFAGEEFLLKTIIRYLGLFLFAVVLTIPATATPAEEGTSPFDPAPAGTRLLGIVECGRGYTTHELYNMAITLQEVIRGESAWERLLKASGANKPADEGFEYVLARVKFEYSARNKPGLCIHKLTPEQFIACSSEGEEYPAVGLSLPEPELRGDLRSGDSLEGWIALLVPESDMTPLLFYSADSGRAVMHGGNIWFKLY